jgi:hypothetical protein
MHKESSRRRLGDTIEDETATESLPSSTRMIKHTSFCLPWGGSGSKLGGDGDEGTAWPGMGLKQNSLSSLPRQISFKNLTDDEQMKMPRLVKQSSFESIPGELCDAKQSIGSRPKHPSRPQRRCTSRVSLKPNRQPELTFRTDDSDETTDTLSSMPRLVKQTSSRGPLLDDNELAGNDSYRRQQMTKQKSFTLPRRRSLTCGIQDKMTMPKRRSLTFESKDKGNQKADTLSSTRRLVKQTSFTGARLSSRGPLLDDDENGAKGSDRRKQMAKQKSLTMPKRRSLTFESKDKGDEKTDTLASMPRLVKQTSLTGAKLSCRGPLIGDDDENRAKDSDRRKQMVKQKSLTMPKRRSLTCDNKDKMDEMTDTLSSTLRLVEQAEHLLKT